MSPRRLLALVFCACAAEDVTLWRHCPGSVGAYAAAWLVRRDTFMETSFGDKLGMEFHDFFVFHQGGNGRPRVSLKSADAGAFWVDHLGGFEHAVMRDGKLSTQAKAAQIEAQLLSAEARCSAPHTRNSKYPENVLPPLALVPFWAGAPEVDSAGRVVGNSHSKSSRETKIRQLRLVLCSIENALPGARVVVGVANAADADALRQFSDGNTIFDAPNGQKSAAAAASHQRGPPPLFAVLHVDCAHGAFLSFSTFRRVQAFIDGSPETWSTDYVYFTEADQLLHSNLPTADIFAALGQHVYVQPNRLHQRQSALVEIDGRPDHAKRGYGFDMNICGGALVAVSASRATRAPPHPASAAARSGKRGGPVSWPAVEVARNAVTAAELSKASKAARYRGAQVLKKKRGADHLERYTYATSIDASAPLELANDADAAGFGAFARCWDADEKSMSAWFVHATAFASASVGKLKAPLRGLGLIGLQIAESGKTWTLATAQPAAFATCHLCQSPPADADTPRPANGTRAHRRRPAGGRRHGTRGDSPLTGRRRHRQLQGDSPLTGRRRHRQLQAGELRPSPCADAPARLRRESLTSAANASTLALMPLPRGGVEDDLALRSVCSVLATGAFDAVVVAVCDGASAGLLMALENAGAELRRYACAAAPPGRQKANHLDHAAALPLVLNVHALVSSRAWRPKHILFAAVGDLLMLRSIDALKAAVSPTAVVVAHRYHEQQNGISVRGGAGWTTRESTL
ncbi:hypothetical protein M885DRAFT_520501 [Pelagophyceae sp. CCMP2097]|nr:hypothetical protein M885DRAFT_520501 [Pelagophyceae sp. CCMP2097]